MADDASMLARMERVIHRYHHAHGKRRFMPDVLLEMVASELSLPRCERAGCGSAGIRRIVVDGADGPVEREHMCAQHVAGMIEDKKRYYIDLGLAVPNMWQVCV